jgi:hypothetical protein
MPFAWAKVYLELVWSIGTGGFVGTRGPVGRSAGALTASAAFAQLMLLAVPFTIVGIVTNE